jgi:signal transduction histidine kinase/FixJ family two-component response regulator
MQYDLFRLYIKNHDVPYWYFLSIAAFFLLIRNFLYGIPDKIILFYGVMLLCVSGFFILSQIFYQKKIMTAKIKGDQPFHEFVLTVALYKILYVVPWLIVLFYPLESDIFYEHVLGYSFLFFMIATSTSSSSPYFPLFFLDISIAVLFGTLIWGLNYDVQETPFVTFFLFTFAIYAFFMARKINLSAIELVAKRKESEVIAKKSERSSRIKSDFLAFISHEIRTPISGILGMAHFLKDTPLSEEQRAHVDTITGCSETLLNTLNDAIDITKIESGKLKIQKKTFDLHGIFTSSVKIIEFLAREKRLRTIVEIGEDVPQYIRSDPYRIQQIIINLLNNAVKFTNQGSIILRVSCPKKNVRRLRIEIIDTGIGISPANQKKLFMQFSQIENEEANHYVGFGLGLSISKNLVSLMKGTIGVSSEENKGATFWFEIPYEASHAQTDEHSAALGFPPTSPLDILLVEDNHINLMIAVRLLEAKGHSVRIARTGAEAIEKIRQKIPALILMDLNMPDQDGIRIARNIFMMGKNYEDIPIVVITANSSGNVLERCRQAGIQDCLLKPYAPKELYRLIDKYGSRSFSKGAEQKDPPVENPKLTALLDVFGPDYTMLFINNSMEEINFLMGSIESCFQKGDFVEMSKVVHDLISVSGSLGFERTYKLAVDMEKACIKIDLEQIATLLPELKIEKARETKSLAPHIRVR